MIALNIDFGLVRVRVVECGLSLLPANKLLTNCLSSAINTALKR